MEIKFVGTGGAFEVNYGNSSCVVTHGGKRYLVDCGHAIFPRLVQRDIAGTIDAALITHLHDDHVGSLSSFILYYSIVLQKGRLKLYCPTQRLRDDLRTLLSFSLGNVEERVEFCWIHDLEGVGYFDTTGWHVPGMPTFAYYFVEEGRSIVYSGDNGNAAGLLDMVAVAQLPAPMIFHEIFFHFRFAGHAYYQDLMALLDRYPIYGYHCDPANAPADNAVPLVAHHPEFNY